MAGLGRGLSSLLDNSRAARAERQQAPAVNQTPAQALQAPTQSRLQSSEMAGDQVMLIELSKLKASPYQPRTEFDSDGLGELAASIREHGLLEPLLVTRVGDDSYQIICGERRYRACCVLELKRVPCLVRDVLETQAYALALIENIQREDLSPLEQAAAMQRMLEECKLTQEQLANTLGKSRSSITNILRLNDLEPTVKSMLGKQEISMGHAKVLLALSGEVQVKTAKLCVERSYSVRQLENFIKELKEKGQERPPQPTVAPILTAQELDALSTRLYGAKVQIKNKNAHQGRITLTFANSAQLHSILKSLGLAGLSATAQAEDDPPQP